MRAWPRHDLHGNVHPGHTGHLLLVPDVSARRLGLIGASLVIFTIGFLYDRDDWLRRFFNAAERTLEIERSVSYIGRKGTRIEKTPKTKSSRRILHVPDWVAEALIDYGMTLDARKAHRDMYIFPSRNGVALRSTSLYRTLGALLDGSDFDGEEILRIARHTVGTMITETMGVSAAASYLGHAKTATTYANYAARKKKRTDVRGALVALDPRTGEPQSEPEAAGISWDPVE